jgi:hypothetical protein
MNGNYNMIKQLMTWIFGKKTEQQATAPEAPYKVEVVPVATADVPVTVETVTTTVLEVKPKFKKAELSKKTKKELSELAVERGLTVKARATKDELVTALLKS